jgi:hypothetical protein
MSPARLPAHGWPLTVVVASLAVSAPLGAQLVSARPASVSLTVVVPSREPVARGVAAEGTVALLATASHTADIETLVSIANRAAVRIEVRLASTWNADSGRVWVRNQRGEFEALTIGGPAATLDAPRGEPGTGLPLRLRVESTSSRGRSSLTIPLDYRVTVGAGDEFSVWTFPSLLRIDPDSVARHTEWSGGTTR